MEDSPSAGTERLREKLLRFMDDKIYPSEKIYEQQLDAGPTRWIVPPIMEELKAEARGQGLWNLFLPKRHFPDGLTVSEYAPLCEIMGRSPLAPEAFNCSAPDTGNMETIVLYGTPEQKERWLKPLMEGTIRSCFAMTEPGVASSDATNIQSEVRRDGDEYVINGRKWWTSGALDPRCKISIVMGQSNPDAPAHQRQSMILVPMDMPGIQIVRHLKVLGFDDAPHGHAEIIFDNVRVPAANMLLGEGRGFEIAQGRLGPGRIHHALRMIGVAERALETMIRRGVSRVAFGKALVDHGVNRHWIAESRIDIEQARQLVRRAAEMMDTVGNKAAKAEIAMIKVVAPNMALRVLDRAIQMCGGGGVSQEFHLARSYAYARALRLADGPDEVHRETIAKLEIAKYRPPARSPRMTAAAALPETIAVSEAQRFDEGAFAAHLAERSGLKLIELRQMSGGQSNPTFLVVTDGAELVLRKQPPGKLLPSAHALDREFRALSALAGTDIPVPKAIAYCDDPAVIGTPFYLMERLRGRVFNDPVLPGMPGEERRAIYLAMATALGKLHLIDPQAVGLEGFGRPTGYYERQLARWTGQWEKSKTRENPSIDKLVEWLPRHLPAESHAAIIHGDFRLNNLMFDPVEPRVIGILDWELATLGPAVADLTHNCVNYFMPRGHPSSLPTHDLGALGIPAEEEYLEHYSTVAGARELPGAFHRAFALFRLAVIAEGIAARAKAGTASNARAVEVGASGLQIADQGWRLASGATSAA